MMFSLPVMALALCSVSTLWAADPVLGTWNLNLAKSKYFPGPAHECPGKNTVIPANPLIDWCMRHF
jgi:hypothetical protein